ncbi:hypothetical protein pb186bvf_001782 [Paramecium bursaria]
MIYKKVWINIDLVLDYHSLVNALTKQYKENFDNTLINKYLKVLKPQIGAIETSIILQETKVKFLQKQTEVHFFWHRDYPELKITHPYLKLDELLQSDNQLIFESRPGQPGILIKNFDFKNKEFWGKTEHLEGFEQFEWDKYFGSKPDFQEPQYKVNSIPNAASEYWDAVMDLGSIFMESRVIHGHNRGGTQLGIPTANMEITPEIEQQISHLVPGIYIGKTQLREQIYGSVLSIGFNPYYNNANKSVEINLFGEFEDFYDEKIKLEIKYFLRPEADFKCFDHFIKSMNNDKWTAKKILSSYEN